MSTVRFLQMCSKEQAADFLAEFNATEETIKDDVENLKEWMRKQPHLPNIDDDEWLANFLLRCKNSREKTKKMLEGYYTARALMPEIFQNRDPSTKHMEQVFKKIGYIPTPKLTADGHRILIFRIFDEHNAPDPDSFIKMSQICVDYSIKYDKIRGMIVIYDFGVMPMHYVTLMFSTLKKLFTLATKTTPCRYHKTYILNLIPAIEPMVSFGKSLVKKELADRVEVWRDKPTDLVNVLSKEVLPKDYGGELPSLEEMRDQWYKEVKTFKEWLSCDEKNKADLSKKPYDGSCSNDVTAYGGVEGSFRKICLD